MEESPTTQQSPSQTPGNRIPLFIGLLVIGLVMVIGAATLLLGKSQLSNNTTQSNTNIITSPTPIQPEPTIIKDQMGEATNGPLPESSELYVGTYKNEDVIFFTPPNTTSNAGKIVKANGATEENIDYHSLSDLRILYAPKGGTSLYAIQNFIYTKDKEYLGISALWSDPTLGAYPNDLINKVYVVTMKNLTTDEVWSNTLKQNKYNLSGAASVTSVGNDQYIALSLINCYACEGSEVKTIVINSRTKTEKDIGLAGNITFDIPKYTFSYQKKNPISVSCSDGPGCENGKMTVYKPSGNIITSQLP